MNDHISRMQEGLEKIKEGVNDLNRGPASFTLECLFAAYKTLTTEYTPFKVGDRVELTSTPPIERGIGWLGCRHILVPGNVATVQHVSCDSQGRLRFDIDFDLETWIDHAGEEQPFTSKHTFSFFASELQRSHYGPIDR